MLFPSTRAWTPLQKWLVIGGVVFALTCFGMFVHIYELYHRGPSESVFFGVWETDGFMSEDRCLYVEFKANHDFAMSSSPTMEAEEVFLTGRWYAGGPNMYVRLDLSWSELRLRPWVWRIMDIKPDEFQVRMHDDDVHTYRRVPTSGHALRQTPKVFRVAEIVSR